MPSETLYRSATFSRSAINEQARTVAVAFSSESPVERQYGSEILSHAPGAVNLSRLKNAAPVLSDHDLSRQIGVVENPRIDGKVGRATLRFGKSSDAEREWQDVRDGIRTKVSVGYSIQRQDKTVGDDGDTYTATLWTPHEISLVAVEADTATGVGRSISSNTNKPTKAKTMSKIETPEKQTTAAELQRHAGIKKLVREWNLPEEIATRAIKNGESVDEVAIAIANRAPEVPDAPPFAVDMFPNIRTQRKTYGRAHEFDGEYSLSRAIHSTINTGGSIQGHEAEASRYVGETLETRGGNSPFNFTVPYEELATRTLQAGGTEGAELISPTYQPNILPFLSEHSVLANAGADIRTGLTGSSHKIRVEDALPVAEWVAEGSEPSASDSDYSTKTLTPKSCHARSTFSMELVTQSPTIRTEQEVRIAVSRAVSRAVDLAGLHGTGAGNQPAGLSGTSGIGSVSAAAAALDWDLILEFESDVAAANSDFGKLGWITNPYVRASLKGIQRFTSTDSPIWESGTVNQNGLQVGQVNGYPAYSSMFVEGTPASGNHHLFFGNWMDLIVGFFGGGVQVQIDPFTRSTFREVVVNAYAFADILVQRPGSFAECTDALA